MDLITQLGTDDHAAATDALVSLGEEVVTSLCEALSDPSWRVAAGAAFTLGKIGSQEAVAPLVLTLETDRFFVREAVVWALGQIGGAASVAAIFELLRYNVASAYDADLVAVSAEAISRHPAEAAPFLDSFIDREGLAASSHNTALKILSRMPDELAIAPLILIMCFSECYFESAESALARIGFPVAKVLIDLLFHPSEEVKKGNYTDGAIAALIEINDVRVVDLLMDHVQEDIAGDNNKYVLKELSDRHDGRQINQYGRRITERLLEIAINPRNEEESAEVWDWLGTLLDSKYSHFYVDDVYSHSSLIPSYRYLPEPLNRIVQTVIDKHKADSDSDEELKDAILQALTAIAAISEAEEASGPQPLQRETSRPPQQSGEELISAMLDRENSLLKTLEGQSAVEAVESLLSQIEKEEGDLEKELPLFKAMALIGPEAIKSLFEYWARYRTSRYANEYGYAQMALEAMNISALGADAVPPLLHALRQFLDIDAPKAHEEIWKYLVAVGPAALPGLEDEIRIAHKYYAHGSGKTEILSKEKIDIYTLFDIREEIMEAYNVVPDASSESLLDDFVQAIQYGDAQYAKRFIITNPDLIHLDINGKKALEIRDGSEDTDFYSLRAKMTEMLLKQGADINAQNQEGNTALHLAVMQYCSDNGDNSYETLLRLLQFEPVLTVENNEEQTAWDEAADRDVERVCFWLGEAEQLQHANKMKIERIKYTLVETDEEIEVRDIAAFDWEGKRITLEDHEITGYQNYFLGRRNYYGGLGNHDDNPVGQLVWDVSRRRMEPAPNLEQL